MRKIGFYAYDSQQELSNAAPNNMLYGQQPMLAPQPISAPGQQLFAMPNQEDVWQQRELQCRQITANIEIEKKRELACIDICESKSKAMIHSDVAAQRTLQLEKIVINMNGTVNVLSQRFGADQKGILQIRIKKAQRYRSLESDCADILYILVESVSRRDVELYLFMNRLEDCQINRAFDRVGINFNFKKKKETEIRKKLVLTLAENADTLDLPQRHGWYEGAEGLQYAYPDKLTWKEVTKWISRK